MKTPMPLHDNVEIRVAVPADLSFLIHLHRKNSELLGFIPRAGMLEHIEYEHVLLAMVNGQHAAYIIHGAAYECMKIFQACVEYDARRMYVGMTLVEHCLWRARFECCDAVSLRIRDSHPARIFWGACGFSIDGVYAGGAKRQQRLMQLSINLHQWKPIFLLEDYLADVVDQALPAPKSTWR